MFKQHGYVWGTLKPNLAIANSAWFLAAPPREKDISTLMPYIMPSAKRVGSSQTIGRCRPSAQERVGACAPSMKIWDYELRRYWVGREAMQIQGIDWENIPNIGSVAETDLGDVAGNAFAGTCIMAVFLSAISSVTLQAPKATTQVDDDLMQAAMTMQSESDTLELSTSVGPDDWFS